MTNISLHLLTTLSICFAACGEVIPINPGGDGGANGDGDINKSACEAPIAFEDLTGCLIDAQCEQFVRCEAIFADVPECVELLPTLFTEFELQFKIFGFAIDADKINYDPSSVSECLESFAGSACGGDGGGDEACDAVFTGDTSTGDDCFIGEECGVLGSECRTDDCGDFECCQGSCQDPVGIGESCDFGERCEPGAHCVATGVAGVRRCETGDDGSPCNGLFDCDSDLFCDNTQCAPTRIAGASCDNSFECFGDNECVSGSCSAVDAVGLPCQDRCLGSLDCVNGECVPIPGAGEDCTDSDRCNSISLQCVGTAANKACVEKQGLGEPCDVIECQPGLFCEDELPSPPIVANCIEPLPIGSECDGTHMCDQSSCEFNMQVGKAICIAPIDCYED